MGNLHLVTIVIIVANIIISYKGFGDFNFFEKYKFQVGAVQRGEKIRLFSSGFLHADECERAMKTLTMFEMVGENLQDQVVFRLDSYEAAVPAGYHNSP